MKTVDTYRLEDLKIAFKTTGGAAVRDICSGKILLLHLDIDEVYMMAQIGRAATWVLDGEVEGLLVLEPSDMFSIMHDYKDTVLGAHSPHANKFTELASELTDVFIYSLEVLTEDDSVDPDKMQEYLTRAYTHVLDCKKALEQEMRDYE